MYATLVDDSTLILPEGIGLCGFAFESIEISQCHSKYFIAIKQIAEVVEGLRDPMLGH